MCKLNSFTAIFGAIAVMVISSLNACAQAPLATYTDGLVNGFEDWSWATRDLNNASPVHTGNRSISASAAYW